MTKEPMFPSLFVKDLHVRSPAYITELILNNKLLWRQKKGENIDRPKCPFWKKDFAQQNPAFKQLAKDYMAEIGFVQDLLKTFSAATIIDYVQTKGIITFIYLPNEKRKTTLYQIWQQEVKRQKELAKLKKATPDIEISDSEYKKRQSKPNKLQGLL